LGNELFIRTVVCLGLHLREVCGEQKTVNVRRKLYWIGFTLSIFMTNPLTPDLFLKRAWVGKLEPAREDAPINMDITEQD